MKKIVKRILASLTLGIVAISSAVAVNAASVSGSLNGYSVSGSLNNTSGNKAAATASSSYGGGTAAIYTEVTLEWGFGNRTGTARNSGSGDRNKVTATATASDYGSVFLSARGSHKVSAGSYFWSDTTSIG